MDAYKCTNPDCNKAYLPSEWNQSTQSLLLNRQARRAYTPVERQKHPLVYKCPGCGLKVYTKRVELKEILSN